MDIAGKEYVCQRLFAYEFAWFLQSPGAVLRVGAFGQITGAFVQLTGAFW